MEVFGALPAEVCMELVHMFCTIKLKEGETLIWKGDVNHDVYVLIKGELAVFISQDGRGHCVARLREGDLIGEMAFLTRDARQATVRATTAVECLVLRDIDLHILSYKHPDIMMTIGRVLARRLAEMNRTLQNQSMAERPAKRDQPPANR